MFIGLKEFLGDSKNREELNRLNREEGYAELSKEELDNFANYEDKEIGRVLGIVYLRGVGLNRIDFENFCKNRNLDSDIIFGDIVYFILDKMRNGKNNIVNYLEWISNGVEDDKRFSEGPIEIDYTRDIGGITFKKLSSIIWIILLVIFLFEFLL